VTLVGRREPGPHLGNGHHHFEHRHRADDLGDLRRCHRRGQLDHVSARDVDVHELAGEVEGVHLGHCLGVLQPDAVVGDEGVDHVEIGTLLAIELDNLAALDANRRLGVVRAVHGHESNLRPFGYEPVLVDGPGVKRLKTL
jgi:hypothetical protein